MFDKSLYYYMLFQNVPWIWIHHDLSSYYFVGGHTGDFRVT
jgi:hypothetical protein